MAAIDVGPGVGARAYGLAWYTRVGKANPANLTGTIDHLDLTLRSYTSGTVDFASFFVVTGDNLTTNGTALALTPASGDNNFDAPGDFTAFDIEAGEYLGIEFPSTMEIEWDLSGGGGEWSGYHASFIPCTNQAFSPNAGYESSIYGTGVEASSYTPCVIMIG